MLRAPTIGLACLVGLGLAAVAGPAWAQAHNPFSVGISEGGGSASGVTGWLLAQQGWLEHELSLGIRSVRLGNAAWPLIGMSFVYGVFHAAGPGHGKAVLSSYMVANERALRRGVVLSFAAALLQGCVAILLIGAMTLVLHATAARVKSAASLVETISFVTIVLLGIELVWRKGRALVGIWHATRVTWASSGLSARGFEAPMSAFALQQGGQLAVRPLTMPMQASRFACGPADVVHPADCLHCHGPDPRMLGSDSFDWKEAAVTVLAAGLRPCSGAILVLVFAFSQGVFGIGALAVLAMSLGVAVTTGALATLAVAFKAASARLAGRGSRRAMVLAASVEFSAACAVLLAGCLLLGGYAALLGGS